MVGSDQNAPCTVEEALRAYAQDVEIGPVRVDTGNDYLDIGAAAVLIVLVAFLYILVRRLTR